jgi:hypothetical protein
VLEVIEESITEHQGKYLVASDECPAASENEESRCGGGKSRDYMFPAPAAAMRPRKTVTEAGGNV